MPSRRRLLGVASRRTAGRAGTALLAASLALAGCTSGGPSAGGAGSGGSEQRFVAGDESITRLAPAQREAPRNLEGTTLDGKRFRLQDARGKVVVVNTWAHWCGPCREEAPALERAWQALRGKGVVFVGVNTRDDPEPARAFVRSFSISYPSVLDPDGGLLLGFRDTLPPNSLPSTLILDREGRVATRVLGPVREVTLRNLVEDVLAGAPA